MQWPVRLETKTSRGEVRTTELVTISRPVQGATLADIGLGLSEAKALLAGLQVSLAREQVAEYAAFHRACPRCQALLSLKDRRTRRLQTLFGTIAVEAPRFRRCHCAQPGPTEKAAVSPLCTLLTARCTPEMQRVQAEFGARTSFRDAVRILEGLLPVSPTNHESVRTGCVANFVAGRR